MYTHSLNLKKKEEKKFCISLTFFFLLVGYTPYKGSPPRHRLFYHNVICAQIIGIDGQHPLSMVENVRCFCFCFVPRIKRMSWSFIIFKIAIAMQRKTNKLRKKMAAAFAIMTSLQFGIC